MSDRRKPYPFDTFEPKWQAHWRENKTFRTPGPGDPGFDPAKPKYYVLDMFPYPSGSGLHVGHPEGYTATDIVARYKRRRGFNVLHPMGWDAFGLPAEQHAINTGEHPGINTQRNIDNFRRQLQSLGFCYDWDREINTTDPNYLRWTQWIFLQLYNSYFDEESQKAKPVSELEKQGLSREQIDDQRLAYVAEVPVNWSPDLGTVLANEEVEEWRAKGHTIERRPLRQWMLRITKYAERLIHDLDLVDWPESIKLHQRNWIGRSTGAEVDFPLPSLNDRELTVFTTRPDTLFGATYIVLAPEHPLVDSLTTDAQRDAVEKYKDQCANKSDFERIELAKDKSGVFTGAHATNPVNNQPIPIWIADYVLMGYGTGAIMAVPAHDERDFEFASRFSLPVIKVVSDPDNDETTLPFTDPGISCNSEFLDGLPTGKACGRMIAWLEEKGCGRERTTYKLRDWLFSRQRYWGEPFPIVWENGKHRAIPESELPLLQPDLEDFRPTGDPRGPLAKATEWIRYSDSAERETNTMPQWAGSCWYYLRYCDPDNHQQLISKDAESYWLGGEKGTPGVDLYIGGTEHAVLHLLYARFWHKVLFDLGHLSAPEPFHKLVNQGLILGEDGQKMSKSRGNVVNPDDVTSQYGADSLRLYEMFMGPLEQVKPWSMSGVEGVSRFLAKVWRLAFEQNQEGEWSLSPKLDPSPLEDKSARKTLHETIRKVGEDIEKLSFNTAISQMMICTKVLSQTDKTPVAELDTLLALLNPFAPHLSEEIHQHLATAFPDTVSDTLLSECPWPEWNPDFLTVDEINIVVQVNGKTRDMITVPASCPKEEIETLALKAPKAAPHIEGKTIRKIIVVPNRLVNVVAN